MSLAIKAFLHEQSWRGEPVEIRRFSIDQDVSTSFAYLLEKIVQVFPSVQAANVAVAWKDSEGDLIIISSDEELVQALDQFDGTLFHLYLKKRNTGRFQAWPPHVEKQTSESGAGESDQTQQQQQEPAEGEPSSQPGQEQQQQQSEGVFHPGVTCDGCNGPIHGIRYKCLVCSDYDLCAGCEAKGKHVDHNMVTINDPFSYNPWGFQNPWAHGFGGRPCHGGWWGQHGLPGHHGFPPQHPCGGRGPWGFGGGHPPCFRGGHPGHRSWGGGAPCWRGAANKEAGQASGTSEPMETSADSQQQPQQQQAQQQQQQPGCPQNEEERRKFLHGVGEAVSSFLEPFGIKVDVDVVGGEEKPPTAPPPSGGASPSAPEVPGEVIEQVVAQLRSMGYEDEGGWLTELVRAKGGDITKVLDALHPTVTETD